MFSMTSKFNKNLAILLLTTILLIALSPICFANSSEPPSIIIVVPNAPPTLNISITTDGEELDGYMEKKFMETQFIFYSLEYKAGTEYSINVFYRNTNETILLGTDIDSFYNIYELDYEDMTIEKGTSGYRVWLYTAIRIMLTLAFEAVIFFVFKFREKRSWLVFLIINLITQGVLNIWLGSFTLVNAYLILALVIVEVFVIQAEIIGFLIFIKEHTKLKTVLYVILANIVSLFLGGYLITLMPM